MTPATPPSTHHDGLLLKNREIHALQSTQDLFFFSKTVCLLNAFKRFGPLKRSYTSNQGGEKRKQKVKRVKQSNKTRKCKNTVQREALFFSPPRLFHPWCLHLSCCKLSKEPIISNGLKMDKLRFYVWLCKKKKC